MDKYKFGNFIYTKRKELNITQEDLGKKLGVTNKAVSKWETGETLPDINLLEPLANILKVSINELVTLEKDQIHYEKDPHRIKFIIAIIALAVILVVTIIAYAIDMRVETHDISLNEYNFLEYYQFNEGVNFYNDDLTVTIENEIIKNTEYEIIDSKFVISYQLNFIYHNTEGKISTITYFEKDLEIELVDNKFYIVESPINEITDYVDFYGYTLQINIIPTGTVKDVVKE